MPAPIDRLGRTIAVGDTIRIPDWTFPAVWNGEAYTYSTPCRYATVTNTWTSGELRATSSYVYDMTAPREDGRNPFEYESYYQGNEVTLIETQADRVARNNMVSEGANPDTLGVREYNRDARGRFQTVPEQPRDARGRFASYDLPQVTIAEDIQYQASSEGIALDRLRATMDSMRAASNEWAAI